MKKFSILYIVLVIFGIFFLVYGTTLLTKEDLQEISDPYITGIIYEISDNRILVAEGITGEEYDGNRGNFIGNAGWFTVREETVITRNEKNLTFDNLKKGNKVTIMVSGLIMESYPVQATASQIEILEEDLLVKCFIGGCSGELCTDDPEAISTCELLPGMECLKEEMACELVEKECTWVLSQTAAECFLAVKEEQGDQVAETRINYFFEKAEKLLKK